MQIDRLVTKLLRRQLSWLMYRKLVCLLKTRVPIATLAFAVFAVLVMVISIFGVGIFFTPDPARCAENAFPHSPDGIPGSVQIKFLESGLTSGTSWSVTLTYSSTHSTLSSTASDIIFNAVKDTQYSYSVSTVFGTIPSPSSGSLNSGSGVTVDVAYSPAYEVTFAQNSSSALPTGTQWTARLGSSSYSATGTSISVGVSDGTFSYSVGRLSQYSPIPASGSAIVSGTSVQIEVYFINNTTTISSIKKLVNYFDPNWNYSSIDLAGFTYTADNVAGYYNDSACGALVLNNTTYSFTFWQTDLNSTTTSTGNSTINLTNSTYVARNGSNHDESWTNTTTLNDTYRQFANLITQTSTKSSGSDYANRTLDMQYYNSDANPTNATSYDNSTTAEFSNATYLTLSNGDENATFNASSNNRTASGFVLLGDPNQTLVAINGNITGYMMNGSSREYFTAVIKNGNGTISLNSDPINFTLDPVYTKKYYWWGFAEMVSSVGYAPYAISSIGSLITFLSTMVASFGLAYLAYMAVVSLASSIAFPVLLAVAGWYLYDMGNYQNSNGNIGLYIEGGFTFSWFAGINWLYMETGFYSDQYKMWNGQEYHVPGGVFEYFPFYNIYEGILAEWFESPHLSIWPPGDSGWHAWP